jgi:hypothetical protein
MKLFFSCITSLIFFHFDNPASRCTNTLIHLSPLSDSINQSLICYTGNEYAANVTAAAEAASSCAGFSTKGFSAVFLNF